MSLLIKTIRTFLKNRNGRSLSLYLNLVSFNVFFAYTFFKTISLFFEDPELLKIAVEGLRNFIQRCEEIPTSVWLVIFMVCISFGFLIHLMISYWKLCLKTSLVYSYLVDLSKKKIRIKKLISYAKTKVSKILFIDIIYSIPIVFISLAFVGFTVWNFSNLQSDTFIIKGESIDLSQEFANKLLIFYISILVYIVLLWLYKVASSISHHFSYVFAIMSRRSVLSSVSSAISLHIKNIGSSYKGRFGVQMLIWLTNILVFLFVWIINRYIIEANLEQIVGVSNTVVFILYVCLGIFFVLVMNISSAMIKSLKLAYYRELFIAFYTPGK